MIREQGSAEVVLDRVCKSFGNGMVVDRVSFSVEPGTCFGLLGANGAGKSTTLKMICGSLRPTSGSIRVAGVDMVAYPREAKRFVGVAPQDDALDPELTAAENLFFHACYSGVPRVEACALVPRWLELMGLDGRGNTAVQSLSSGLRRRLVLARALMNEPRVVLLDEPTRGLDGESRAQYLEILQGMKRQGATLLLATHEMEEAATLCDQAARLERGSVCEVGPVHEVLRAADSLARLPEVRGAGAC